MISISDELYQEVILEHNKKPKNYGKLEKATHFAEGYNPICGDHIWVYLNRSDNGKINNVSFEGDSCAICRASASMMTVSVAGNDEKNVRSLFNQFHEMVVGKVSPEGSQDKLGKLKIFSGVWKYPSRVKCAILAWHTLISALDRVKVVTTE